MKNTIFSLFLLIIAIIFSGCAETATISLGGKTTEEIAASQKLFWEQIDQYKENIANLESNNNALAAKMSVSGLSKEVAVKYSEQIKANELLIIKYRSRILNLEDMVDDFTVRSAGSDQQKYIHLNGRDVKKTSEAYMMIEYAENAGRKAINNADQLGLNSAAGLQGILENNRNDEVIATTTGPGGFLIEFKIGRKSKSQTFQLPCMGEFTTTFVSCENALDRESIKKVVAPGVTYYDGTTPYAYKATAIRKN